MSELNGKVAIVTGAARGMGIEIAERLAREGMDLVVCDISESIHEVYSERILGKVGPNRGFSRVVDVTKSAQVDALVAETVSSLGSLFLMVNNAGVLQKMMDVTDTPDETLEWVLNVNVRGTFFGCRAAARVMREAREGQIVTVSSWYGRRGHPSFGAYCASKAAVIKHDADSGPGARALSSEGQLCRSGQHDDRDACGRAHGRGTHPRNQFRRNEPDGKKHNPPWSSRLGLRSRRRDRLAMLERCLLCHGADDQREWRNMVRLDPIHWCLSMRSCSS